MAEVELSALQGWMLATCTSPGDLSEALRDATERFGIEASTVVKATPALSVHDRVGIYARAYLGRLLECLRMEFSVLRAMVGDQVFDLFAKAYVWAHPPESCSMLELGAGFADFLERTRPQPAAPAGSPDAVPAAVARLERARFESHHARGVETDERYQSVDPLSLMIRPDVAVRTPQTLHLLHLDFDLSSALAAVEAGARPDLPESLDTDYAVARSHYRVRAHVVMPWQHAFLGACGTEGISLSAAAGSAARTCGMDPTQMWASLFTWLPLAVDAGMLTVGPIPGRAHYDGVS